MDEHEDRNGTSSSTYEGEDEYVTIYFLVGQRKEATCFRPDQISNLEVKDLFRTAAEAGPHDIVKLRKGDKVLNITPQLPANKPDEPYNLEVVGVHAETAGMIEADLLHALEKRVETLEQNLRKHEEATADMPPCVALQELKKQVDSFREKLENTEKLTWLGFHKQLPEPLSSEACRRLRYRRVSDEIKRGVRQRFMAICDLAVSSHVRQWLRSPTFDARQWEDEELLLMLQTMFIELGLLERFNISLTTLRNFIYEVYNNYNEVPFHNFRHCFCVAQMMYAMVWAVDLMSKFKELDVLILIVSCMCHDLDHPGYNNIYQINARTELALRYNDISPLENHHCSVAFRVLELGDCNILANLSKKDYNYARECIIRCILATDMARHNEILNNFTDIVPIFDFKNEAHVHLLSMVLIKVADISNEARPIDVADPWLDSLLQEFFKQSDAEKLEGLPVTPFMDRDKVTKPSSQCSFIGLVLLPLFETLGDLFPELQTLIVEPVRFALEYYRRLNEAAKDERHQRKSVVELSEHAPGNDRPSGSTSPNASGGGLGGRGSTAGLPSGSVVKSSSTHSMRSKRSTGTLHSRSRSIEDEAGGDSLTIEEGADPESSDPETATEVEVSEKTLKFKISTEGNIGSGSGAAGRKSYPGSRKGSREKSSLDYHNHDLAKALREHERERRRSRGENFSSDMSSPLSARSNDNESRIVEELERDEQRDDRQLVELVLAAEGRPEGNGSLILNTAQQRRNNRINKRTASVDSSEREPRPTSPKEIVKDVVRCCCDDKAGPNNHKSLLTRLRNFTDRLSISFDSKEAPAAKPGKCPTAKPLGKSVSGPSARHGNIVVCKKCNQLKSSGKECRQEAGEPLQPSGGGGSVEKRSMTLPKARRSQDSKNKSWRTVFAKEKRPSVSLETLPAGGDAEDAAVAATLSKHRRNLSNPEGKSVVESPKSRSPEQPQISFKEIDFRPAKPEIHVDPVNPGSSTAVEDIGKVEIRRSSASMEDISKITKQNDLLLGGSLEQQKSEECQQHAGSLDSMLCKEAPGGRGKPVAAYGPSASSAQPKKPPSAGLFSRFKSGMSIDGGSSNSGSLHEQQTAGWISSLTASFRPRKQPEPGQQSPAQATPSSPAREEVK